MSLRITIEVPLPVGNGGEWKSIQYIKKNLHIEIGEYVRLGMRDDDLAEVISNAESSDESIDLRCEESFPSQSSSDESSSLESVSDESFSSMAVAVKEKSEWNFTTYIVRREIGFDSFREKMWIETTIASSKRAMRYMKRVSKKYLIKPSKYADRSMASFLFDHREKYQSIQFRVSTNSRGSTMTICVRPKESLQID